MGDKVVNNRFSRREQEFLTPKPAGVKRILALGDSFTWGAGLATSERYTDQLDSMLNEELPEGRWEVVNFGFSGGPTTGELDVLKSVKDAVEPDMIMVGFCLNDPQPKSQDYSPEREAFRLKHQRRIDAIKARLVSANLVYFADLLEFCFYRAAEKLDYMPEWEEALDQTYDETSSEWQDFVAALKEIKAISDSMKCEVPIFVALNQIGAIEIPEEVSELSANDPFLALRLSWFQQARSVADSLGYQTVSFEHEFNQRLKSGALSLEDLTLNPLDAHPSAAMNKVYAQGILAAIKNRANSTKQVAKQ